MHFSDPTPLNTNDKSKAFVPASDTVHIPPGFTKAQGFLVWYAPVDGHYYFHLTTKEAASLSIDGKVVLQQQHDDKPLLRVEKWLTLTKGMHLFRVRLDSTTGDDFFSVGVTIPPLMRGRQLKGEDVAVPDLGSIHTWSVILTLLHQAKLLFAFFSTCIALCFLLPMALTNRSVSILITVGIALAPAIFIPVEIQREPYIGKMVHKELQEKNPDFVFIGNSMLWSRIDDEYLEKLLDGKKVYSIVNFGGLSAIHYLSFKYLFIPAKITPKKVFIFFRSNQFIIPRMRTSDRLAQQTVQRLTPAPDPVYEKIVHGRSRSTIDTVYNTLLNFFPIGKEPGIIRNNISDIALNMASIMSFSNDQKVSRQKNILALVNKRFSITSGFIREDIDTKSLGREKIQNTYDFYGHVENSFLPHILEIAHDNNISLVFIRVQDRPQKNIIPSDPPILRQYMDDLRTYLTDHNAFLYDFTGDPELPLSAYHDGDHIKDQKKYTELFVKRVGYLLK